MGCYDRIIRNHAILCSRKIEISDNICKSHCQPHDKIHFKTQIKNKKSITSYKITKQLKLYGVGQGAGNIKTRWTFISVPMIEVIETLPSDCTIQLPSSSKTWIIHMIGFVDNKRYYVNKTQ